MPYSKALIDLQRKKLLDMFEHMNTIPASDKKKMSYAHNLLLNSDKSIVNISLEVGFDNLGHFYKLFEETYGMPPVKYRKTHWRSPHLWL